MYSELKIKPNQGEEGGIDTDPTRCPPKRVTFVVINRFLAVGHDNNATL